VIGDCSVALSSDPHVRDLPDAFQRTIWAYMRERVKASCCHADDLFLDALRLARCGRDTWPTSGGGFVLGSVSVAASLSHARSRTQRVVPSGNTNIRQRCREGWGGFPEFAEFGGHLGTTSLFLLVGHVSSPWIILEKSAGVLQGTGYLAPRISRCLADEDYILPKSA
jgi:hypothetical protein